MNDFRLALRQLLRSPGFTAVAVLTLALGIGANTAIFTLINSLLLRPLPGVGKPEGLVRLSHGSFSYAKFEALKAQQIFENTVAFSLERFPADLQGALQPARVMLVSGDYFSALGVKALLGRTIGPEDDRTRAPVTALSHGCWQRWFAGDPEVVGKSLRVSGLAVTIVGVTPPDFIGVLVGSATDLTMPVTTLPQLRPERPGILTERSAHWLQLIGRLAPGQSVEQANARVQVSWPQVLAGTAEPGTPANSDFFRHKTELQPFGRGFSELRGEYTSSLYVLMGLVGIVLLMACANVANLLLARGAGRRRELAVRSANGASHWRLLRQLLSESLVLSGLAALAGTFFAVWGTQVLIRFVSAESGPVFLYLRPDWRVLAFAIGLVLLTALLFGLVPALWATRIDLSSSLREDSRSLGGREGRLRRGLIVAEVTLAMLLAVGAGLFLNSFRQILRVDSGLEPTHVLLARPQAVGAGYRGPLTTAFFTDLLERVLTLPGVEAAGLSWMPPVSRGSGNNGNVSIQGRPPAPGEDRMVWSNMVSPGFFGTIGQKLLAGRDFTGADQREASKVAIINQTMARYFFGAESPIGKRFDPRGGNNHDCEIVGLVRDATHFDLKERPQRVFYLPYAQSPDFFQRQDMVLAVRGTTGPAAAARQVRAVVERLDRNILVETETLRSHIDSSLARERLLAALSGFLGILSLVLVAIGLYGVMAYSIARRRGEIGLRIALGARPRAVLAMVIREGFVLLLIGVAIGSIAAFAFGHVLSHLLFGITPRDAFSFAGAVIALSLTAVLATLVPARSAARIDPMQALRCE